MGSVTYDSTEYVCTSVNGDVAAPKTMVEVFHLPGYDGYGAQTFALGGSEGQFRVIFHKLLIVDAIAWIEKFEEMQGQTILVSTDIGIDYDDFLVAQTGKPRTSYVLWNGLWAYRTELVLYGHSMIEPTEAEE